MNENIIIICTQCGTKNRIPFARRTEQGVCGKCGARLPLARPYTGRPVDVSDLNFAAEVKAHPGPVLVEFTAPW